MLYELSCDSCEFVDAAVKERSAYAEARDHEAQYPSHFVFISERAGQCPHES